MDKNKGIDFLYEIREIHFNENTEISLKYMQFRTILDVAAKDILSDELISFPDLNTRISHICRKKNVSGVIHNFRRKANRVIHEKESTNTDEYKTHLKQLCSFISNVYDIEVPSTLKEIFPEKDYRPTYTPRKLQKFEQYLRVQFLKIDGNIMICENEENDNINVVINHDSNKIFQSIYKCWSGCTLYLVNIDIDESGKLYPKFIILEPDYVVNVTSVAECFKDYGASEYNYLMSKFTIVPNNKAILLGNFANFVVDELFANNPLEVLFSETFKKSFKSNPFEYSTCKDIFNDADFRSFINSAELTFKNIKNVFLNELSTSSVNVSSNEATLEPAFINEIYGIQGRLDIYQKILSGFNAKIIELKSGSVPWPDDGVSVCENHKAQLFMYYQLIARINNILHHQISSRINGFIFYSKTTNNPLREQKPYLFDMQGIFELRNRIVLIENLLATNLESIGSVIEKISFDNLVPNGEGPPWVRRDIDNFQFPIQESTDLEKEYFFSFINFIAFENYIAILGSANQENSWGQASLWRKDFVDKQKEFEILYDLEIEENLIDDDEKEITFKRTNRDNEFVNFREGDICIVYPRETETDNCTLNQVFKGTINAISKKHIVVSFRYKQRNTKHFDSYRKWAIERDFMDNSFQSMYRSLYSFISADKRIRDLILFEEQPGIIQMPDYTNPLLSEEQNRIIDKALKAKDYFLLNGPPGTGKTTIIVKELVKWLYYNQLDTNIILLAYTNRAVDELCDAVNDAINNGIDNLHFIRIGGHLSCAKKHRNNILQNVCGSVNSIDSIRELLNENRVYITTIASMSNNFNLFELDNFKNKKNLLIIDEASQILEPQIVGILTKAEKFIMIGDHKQLPAIAIQNPDSSKTNSDTLENIGLENRKNSLFERLYKYCENNELHHAFDQLTYQGRMHEEIAVFPNYTFYNSLLKEAYHTPNMLIDTKAKLSFQVSKFDLTPESKYSLSDLLAKKRFIFFQSEIDKKRSNKKSNMSEANLVVKLIQRINQLDEINFNENQRSIGVITPFRNQIALIKQRLEEEKIPDYENISVDTVERYQGSQRDIIIFSFSVNHPNNLNSIINLNDKGDVDRKLNVAITRAREQLILIGNDSILSSNLIYYKLIEFIKSRGGYISESIEKIINDEFEFNYFNEDVTIEGKKYSPDEEFAKVFFNLVIEPINNDEKTIQKPGTYLGSTNDYIRNNVIEYGRTRFDIPFQASLFDKEFTSQDKVNLYCFFNMRKHFFSGYSIFESYRDFFSQEIEQVSGRVTFIDIGCGPLTSGLAFNQAFKNSFERYQFKYVGIDISNTMVQKATEFAESGIFHRNSIFKFFNNIRELEIDILNEWFRVSNIVILNFSYVFSNLTNENIDEISKYINVLSSYYPTQKYVVIYQNPVHRHHGFSIFKDKLERINNCIARKTETVSYVTKQNSIYDKSEHFTYEIITS